MVQGQARTFKSVRGTVPGVGADDILPDGFNPRRLSSQVVLQPGHSTFSWDGGLARFDVRTHHQWLSPIDERSRKFRTNGLCQERVDLFGKNNKDASPPVSPPRFGTLTDSWSSRDPGCKRRLPSVHQPAKRAKDLEENDPGRLAAKASRYIQAPSRRDAAEPLNHVTVERGFSQVTISVRVACTPSQRREGERDACRRWSFFCAHPLWSGAHKRHALGRDGRIIYAVLVLIQLGEDSVIRNPSSQVHDRSCRNAGYLVSARTSDVLACLDCR